MARKDLTDQPPEPVTVEGQLQEVLAYLHRAERRDRMRMTARSIVGIIALIPLFISLYFMYYFATHWDEVLGDITKEAVKQSAEYSQGSIMEQLEQYMQQ